MVSPCGGAAGLDMVGLPWMGRTPVRTTPRPEVHKVSPFGRVEAAAGLDAMSTFHMGPTAPAVVQPMTAPAAIRDR